MDRHSLWSTVDNYKRKCFVKNELKRVLLKSARLNKNTPYYRRYLASYYLTTLPRVSTATTSLTRCTVSGRSWGVSKKYGISRFVLRNNVYESMLPGCRRASW